MRTRPGSAVASATSTALDLQIEEFKAKEQETRDALVALVLAQDMKVAMDHARAERQLAIDHRLAVRLSECASSEEDDASLFEINGMEVDDPNGVCDLTGYEDQIDLASNGQERAGPSMVQFEVGQRLRTLAVPSRQIIEVQVGAMGRHSTITAVTEKPMSFDKGKGRMTHHRLQTALCDICQEGVWSKDEINAFFTFRPRSAAAIHFCNCCLLQLAEAASKDSSLLPLSLNGEAIDQGLADLVLVNQPATLQSFRERLEEKTAANKMYCMRPKCSKLINLDKIGPASGAQITCPGCGDLLCGHCRSQWHTGYTCRQYQALPDHEKVSEEDRATAEILRHAEGFQQCSRCKMMVELEQGCFHMTCRCGHEFCYRCAVTWKQCECPLWAEQRLLTEADRRVRRVQETHHRTYSNEAEFRQAVAEMAERLRQGVVCQPHKWKCLKSDAGELCSRCRYPLRHFCYICLNESCGALVCKACRFFRSRGVLL
eukprot:jgi/Botrbrau1/20443/Bobra.145_2s0008.2